MRCAHFEGDSVCSFDWINEGEAVGHDASAIKARFMILDATCQLEYQTTEEVPTIFMLRPRSGWAQWIMREEFDIQPQVPVVEFTDVYGNLCQRIVIV